MKEMLKSKGMILFVIMVLGITYFGAGSGENLETTKDVNVDLISYQAK